jgi:hypothetical protein
MLPVSGFDPRVYVVMKLTLFGSAYHSRHATLKPNRQRNRISLAVMRFAPSSYPSLSFESSSEPPSNGTVATQAIGGVATLCTYGADGAMAGVA